MMLHVHSVNVSSSFSMSCICFLTHKHRGQPSRRSHAYVWRQMRQSLSFVNAEISGQSNVHRREDVLAL